MEASVPGHQVRRGRRRRFFLRWAWFRARCPREDRLRLGSPPSEPRNVQAPRAASPRVDPREAWRRKHLREARPWSGPVHASPLLDGLPGRVVELGAGGGKVGAALPRDALALDWA